MLTKLRACLFHPVSRFRGPDVDTSDESLSEQQVGRLHRSKTPAADSPVPQIGRGRGMKDVNLYLKVRHAVRIEGLRASRQRRASLGLIRGPMNK